MTTIGTNAKMSHADGCEFPADVCNCMGCVDARVEKRVLEFLQPTSNEEYLFSQLLQLRARVYELERRSHRLLNVYLRVRDYIWRIVWKYRTKCC